MLIRIFALIVCLPVIIVSSITVYDMGWSNIPLDLKLITSVNAVVGTFILGFFVLVSDETIARMKDDAAVRARSKSITDRTRFR